MNPRLALLLPVLVIVACGGQGPVAPDPGAAVPAAPPRAVSTTTTTTTTTTTPASAPAAPAPSGADATVLPAEPHAQAAANVGDATAAVVIPDQTGESPPPTGGKPVAPVTIGWTAKATTEAGVLDVEIRATPSAELRRMTVSLRAADAVDVLDAAAESVFTDVAAGETRSVAGHLRLAGASGSIIVEIAALSNDQRGRILPIQLTRDGSKPPAQSHKPAGPIVTGDDGQQVILQPAQAR